MKKYENFCKAFENLKVVATVSAPYNILTITGCVGLFKICFEQAWKVMKQTLELHGYDESQTGSPRMILKLAFRAQLINDEQNWLDMLDSRNSVPHSYNEEIASRIIDRTQQCYIGLFENLKKTLEKDWL